MYPSKGGEFKPLEYPTNVSSIIKTDMPVVTGCTVQVIAKTDTMKKERNLMLS